MGSQLDVMNSFALQELNRIYSTYDGWKMSPKKHGSGYDTIVKLERLHGGHHDIVKVLITFNKEIAADMVEELNNKENVTDGMVPRYDFAVIAPVNTDTSALPANMKIYPMNSFEFKGNDLLWVKKKVAKTQVAVDKKAA
jgi:6-pyruvoyl-tetrahydropterin synthase